MNNGFAADLRRYGPEGPGTPCSLSEARTYCRHLATHHYENFSVASLFLPRPLLPHFHAVYAWCRWADDLGDETGGGQRALTLLRWWRNELLRCFDGRARHPVLVALRETIRRYRIPPQPFLDLLFAFEQDQLVKRYQTYEQLLGYCRCSANPVGRLVLYLFECHNAERGALSDNICTGLQLANFWQDVARDLDIGRVYLPEADRRRFNYSDAELHTRLYTRGFAELMQFEVDRARDLLFRGAQLVELVPDDFQGDVELFFRGGVAILAKIERRRYNVWKSRPALSKWDKASLVGGFLWQRLRAAVS